MQGGSTKLSTDKSVTTTGSDVTVTGPPNDVVIVIVDGSTNIREVKLDGEGKAKVTMPTRPSTVSLILASDYTKSTNVSVIDALR